METKPASFWSSLPGVLTGLAAVLTAAAGLFIAVGRDKSASTPVPLPAVAPVAAAYPRSAVIEDADGFVNVRAAPGARSGIVATIRSGERFAVTPEGSAWWRVRAPDGTTGFVHASRIRLLPEGPQ